MNTADQILNAALAKFYQSGFHATGVDQLSSMAGVTKRTLYRHFQSKESLIDSVLELRDEQFMVRMRTFVEAVPLAERPVAYLDFLETWVNEPDFHGCMFINAAAEYGDSADHPHVLAKAHKERVLAYLEQICREAEHPDAQTLATQLFVMGEGIIVTSQVTGYVKARHLAMRETLRQLMGR